jgi:hypothetical protein
MTGQQVFETYIVPLFERVASGKASEKELETFPKVLSLVVCSAKNFFDCQPSKPSTSDS